MIKGSYLFQGPSFWVSMLVFGILNSIKFRSQEFGKMQQDLSFFVSHNLLRVFGNLSLGVEASPISQCIVRGEVLDFFSGNHGSV